MKVERDSDVQDFIRIQKIPKRDSERKGFYSMRLSTIPLFWIFASPMISGCVSVSLPSSKSHRAEGIQWQSPSAPFEELKDASADQAWMSKKTGNTISFLSECGANGDRSLELLQSEALQALNSAEVLHQELKEYNRRQALFSTAQGKVDGIPVKVRLVTLKKNECNYTITFSGLEKNFESELAFFSSFIEKFEAP